MVSWPSMLTPRSSTADDGLTRADSSGSSVVVSLTSCCHVPSHTSCVLSAFIFSLLLHIQASMRSTQARKCCVETDADAAGALMYTCVSLAYECSTSPALEMMSNNSVVYNRNSNGPRTEPCGTPKSSFKEESGSIGHGMGHCRILPSRSINELGCSRKRLCKLQNLRAIFWP